MKALRGVKLSFGLLVIFGLASSLYAADTSNVVIPAGREELIERLKSYYPYAPEKTQELVGQLDKLYKQEQQNVKCSNCFGISYDPITNEFTEQPFEEQPNCYEHRLSQFRVPAGRSTCVKLLLQHFNKTEITYLMDLLDNAFYADALLKSNKDLFPRQRETFNCYQRVVLRHSLPSKSANKVVLTTPKPTTSNE